MNNWTLSGLSILIIWIATLSLAVYDLFETVAEMRPVEAPAIKMLEAHSPRVTNGGPAAVKPLDRRQYMGALFAVRDEAVAAHALFMDHFNHADDCPKKNEFFEETCPCGFLDVLNAIGDIGEKPLESVMEGR